MHRITRLIIIATISVLIAAFAVPLANARVADTTDGLEWITNDEDQQTIRITGCANNDCPATVTIPASISGRSVTGIGERAFSSATLEHITIPDSVTTIARYAFLDASKLDAIVIPSGVTKIEEQTFYGDAALTSVSLPEGLTTIRNKAFGNTAISLHTLRIPASVTTLDSEALDFISGLTSVYFMGSMPQNFGTDQFSNDPNVTVYHFRGASGWPNITDLVQDRPQAYTLFPATPPAPIAVSGGATSAVVTAAAASIGEAPTSYTITAKPGSRACEADATGICTVTELTPESSYTFTAVAHNTGGDSNVSVASTAVTTTPVVPSAPAPTLTATAPTTTTLAVTSTTTATTITTTFTASGPGTASQTGTAAGAKRGSRATKTMNVCSSTKKIKKAGKVTLTCKLTKAARTLRKKHSLTVLLTTTFTPTSGNKAISTKTIKLGRK